MRLPALRDRTVVSFEEELSTQGSLKFSVRCLKTSTAVEEMLKVYDHSLDTVISC